jgi:DNA-binding response OmpR family regulator
MAEVKPPEMPPKEMTPKALIIDSDAAAASTIASIFSEAGFDALNASDCTDGLAKVEEARPHLVLLAETLSDSGETCSRIRSCYNIPVIMLGNNIGQEAWEQAVALGADAYLIKSISKLELIARAKAILRRYQSHGCPKKSKGQLRE